MREQGQREMGLALSAASAAEGLLLTARWHARAGRRQASQEDLAEAGRIAGDVAGALYRLLLSADAPAKPPPNRVAEGIPPCDRHAGHLMSKPKRCAA